MREKMIYYAIFILLLLFAYGMGSWIYEVFPPRREAVEKEAAFESSMHERDCWIDSFTAQHFEVWACPDTKDKVLGRFSSGVR